MIAIAILAMIACASAQTSVESTTATASVSASGSTAACDVAKYQVCIGDLGKCLSDANGDKTKTCACYPTFFTCSKPFSACPTFASVEETNKKGCTAIECAVCSSATGLVASVTLVASLIVARLF